MHVFQTPGVPPSSGSSSFANIGSTKKSSAELHTSAQKNTGTMTPAPTPRADSDCCDIGVGKPTPPTKRSVTHQHYRLFRPVAFLRKDPNFMKKANLLRTLCEMVDFALAC